MELLQNKSDELLKLLLEEYNSIGIYSGAPFVIFTYLPEKEVEILGIIERIERKLKMKNINPISIKLDILMRKFAKESVNDLEELYSLESEDRDSLKRAIAKEVGDSIISHILSESMRSEKSVLLIYRTGAIYPVLRVHSLLDALENKIKMPLVLFYPGIFNGKKLQFLNKDIPEEGYYYRARIL